jgi:hypothetical protein
MTAKIVVRFMRRALFIILLTASSATAATRPSADPVNELMRARSFCIGCEAYAGTIISGQAAFITVLKRENAATDLQTVFEHGTLEARMYALAGLREIDRSRFEADFARIRTRARSVTVLLTENPPSILRNSTAYVLRGLRAGHHRSAVQWARTGHFSR